MKLTSLLWQQLYKSNPATWTEALLSPCTLDELEGLSRLLGVAFSGSREQRIERILIAASLRVELSGWGEYEGNPVRAHGLADQVAPRYTRKALITLAKRAGVYHGVSKRGIVIGLLQWRDGCRKKGQEFNNLLKQNAVVQYQMALK